MADDRYVPTLRAGLEGDLPSLTNLQEELRRIWENLHKLEGRSGEVTALNTVTFNTSTNTLDFLEITARPQDSGGSNSPRVSGSVLNQGTATGRIYFDRANEKFYVSEAGGAWRLLTGITTLNALTGAVQTFATSSTGTTLGFTSSGTTHTLNVPGLYCVATSTANQSIPDNASTAITFDSELVDVGGFHSNATNPSRFTAPVTGLYLMVGHIDWAASAVGIRQILLRINGGTYLVYEVKAPTAGGLASVAFATLRQLTAGDYVEAEAYQNSGGSLNVLLASQYSPIFGIAHLFA